jgi:hypothetical protein
MTFTTPPAATLTQTRPAAVSFIEDLSARSPIPAQVAYCICTASSAG